MTRQQLLELMVMRMHMPGEMTPMGTPDDDTGSVHCILCGRSYSAEKSDDHVLVCDLRDRNVRTYFYNRLDPELGLRLDTRWDLSSFPMESVVGECCRHTIDAAAILLNSPDIKLSHREKMQLKHKVLDACQVYAFG